MQLHWENSVVKLVDVPSDNRSDGYGQKWAAKPGRGSMNERSCHFGVGSAGVLALRKRVAMETEILGAAPPKTTRKRVRNKRGVFEKVLGSDIWWIRFI
jgi:hypothetical protein